MDEAIARFILAAAPPDVAPIPRAAVYRMLVRNSLRGVVAEAFPVTAEVIGDDGLLALIDAFLDAGGPTTAFFRDIPGDFVAWAEATDAPNADLIAWEWLELLAARHPADLDALPRADASLVRPNPTMQMAVFRRPVHLMGEDERDPAPFAVPMAFLVWRRPGTDETSSHRVGLLIARALAAASEAPDSVAALAARVAAETPGLPVEEIERSLRAACRDLRAEDGLI